MITRIIIRLVLTTKRGQLKSGILAGEFRDLIIIIGIMTGLI